jgi:hypothetical protein
MVMTAPVMPTLWTRLPVGGWQVGFWIDSTGRTYVDVANSRDALVYRGAGSRQAAPSIDAGWTGWGRGPDRGTRCWALAVGRMPAACGHAVSFVSAAGVSVAGGFPADEQVALLPDGWTGLRITEDGLWVATATGSSASVRLCAYSHVRLSAPATVLQCPLLPVGAG